MGTTQMRAIAGGALLCLSALVLLLDEGAAAHTPLQVEGQGGFWNQVVIGQDKAYHERIGGVTIAGKRPIASFVDRETPQMFNKRWDLGSSGGRLIVTRSNRRQMVSVDRGGSAIFRKDESGWCAACAKFGSARGEAESIGWAHP